jgi:hypothetical protein
MNAGYLFLCGIILFSHIDIKKENVHIPDGMAPDLDSRVQAL